MKPEIRDIAHEWGQATSETTELVTTIRVYNPNPFTLPVKAVTGDIEADGIKMGNAEAQELHIEKKTEFPIVILTKIDNAKIPDFWAEHLRRHEKSKIDINMGIVFDLKVRDFSFPYHLEQPLETDLLSMLSKVGPIPIEKKITTPLSGEATIFRMTLKSLTSSWGEVNRESTNLNFSAIVHNDNPYLLPVPWITYDLEMNNVAVASGKTKINYSLPPYSDGIVTGTIVLDNDQLAKSFVIHIQNGESSTGNIKIFLICDAPYQGEIAMPVFDESQRFETDLLDNKNPESHT